jgi:hypothetical protein
MGGYSAGSSPIRPYLCDKVLFQLAQMAKGVVRAFLSGSGKNGRLPFRDERYVFSVPHFNRSGRESFWLDPQKWNRAYNFISASGCWNGQDFP